jgi:hypothetical protein
MLHYQWPSFLFLTSFLLQPDIARLLAPEALWNAGSLPNNTLDDVLQWYAHSRHNTKFIVNIGGSHYSQSDVDADPTYPYLQLGWSGVIIDADLRGVTKEFSNHPHLSFVRLKVTPHNIVEALKRINPPTGFLLKVDIDSFDCQVLASILAVMKPDVIVAEFNADIPPPIAYQYLYRASPVPLTPRQKKHRESYEQKQGKLIEVKAGMYGCSLAALCHTINRSGRGFYKLLAVDAVHGQDAVFGRTAQDSNEIPLNLQIDVFRRNVLPVWKGVRWPLNRTLFDRVQADPNRSLRMYMAEMIRRQKWYGLSGFEIRVLPT